MVNKGVRNAVFGWNLKNNRMISDCFQGKPFNITVIQAYAPTNNAEEAEVEWFSEDLQELLELTQKWCPFPYRGLESKASEEASQIAVNRGEAKSKGEKERYSHLSAKNSKERWESLPQWPIQRNRGKQ